MIPGGYPGYTMPMMVQQQQQMMPQTHSMYAMPVQTEQPQVLQEPVIRAKAIPLVCNSLFNLNEILVKNIVRSDYYLHTLTPMTTCSELIDELHAEAKQATPFLNGIEKLPSTLFCILYRLFELHLTYKEVKRMLTHSNAYVRATGFLYIRVGTDPKKLWRWVEEYISDDQKFIPDVSTGHSRSIGSFVRMLLTDVHYYDTVFKRIPVQIERNLQKYMTMKDQGLDVVIEEDNNEEKDECYVGRIVRAQYSEDAKFYKARIDKILSNSKVLITYIDYDTQEEISLKSIKFDTVHSVNKRMSKEERERFLLQAAQMARREGTRSRSKSPVIPTKSNISSTNKSNHNSKSSRNEREYRDYDSGYRDYRGHREHREYRRDRSPGSRRRSRSPRR